MRQNQVSPGDIVVVTRGFPTGVYAIIDSSPWVKEMSFYGKRKTTITKGGTARYQATKGFLVIEVEGAGGYASLSSSATIDRDHVVERASTEAKRLSKLGNLEELVKDGNVKLRKGLSVTVIRAANATHTLDDYNVLAAENALAFERAQETRAHVQSEVDHAMTSIAHSLHALDSDLDIRQFHGRVDFSNTDIAELARLLKIAASAA